MAPPPPPAAAITEAPPTDPELTGMGELPLVWYDGAVPDLELFGDGTPLETDEVASAPDVSVLALRLLYRLVPGYHEALLACVFLRVLSTPPSISVDFFSGIKKAIACIAGFYFVFHRTDVVRTLKLCGSRS